MKYPKLLLVLLTVLFTLEANASRIKKDLLSSKEDEIVSLLKEKMTILDKLIIEAKIYKSENDPLIQKSFLNTPNLFYSHTRKEATSVRTGSASSIAYNRRGVVRGIQNGSSRDKFKHELRKPRMGEDSYERSILNIKMKSKLVGTTSFFNYINLYTILKDDIKNDVFRVRDKGDIEEIILMLDDRYNQKFKTINREFMRKYFEFIALLSSNNISKNTQTMIALESATKWYMHSKMFTFVFDLRRNKFYKKKNYDLSLVLNDTFNQLHKKDSISLVKIPDYYDRKIAKNLKCIETADEIKYKGRICINPIDVDKDIYFKQGVFESRENNFIQTNSDAFKSLIGLDEKLKKASKDYVEFSILKVISPTAKNAITLEGGL